MLLCESHRSVWSWSVKDQGGCYTSSRAVHCRDVVSASRLRQNVFPGRRIPDRILFSRTDWRHMESMIIAFAALKRGRQRIVRALKTGRQGCGWRCTNAWSCVRSIEATEHVALSTAGWVVRKQVLFRKQCLYWQWCFVVASIQHSPTVKREYTTADKSEHLFQTHGALPYVSNFWMTITSMIADHFRASQDRLTYIRSNFIFGGNLKNTVYGRAVQLIIWGRYNQV